MVPKDLIAANDFCVFHHIEYSFIDSLEDAGLVQLVERNKEKFIEHSQLQELEKIIRLSQDLDINLAGIEVIIHLLKKMDIMHKELISLRNKMSFYEDNYLK